MILNEDLNLKIIDFGFSAKQSPNVKLSMFCGTPAYMSPELINEDYDGMSADVWACGVVLYIMLNG